MALPVMTELFMHKQFREIKPQTIQQLLYMPCRGMMFVTSLYFSFKGTISHMTTPVEFRKNVMQALDILNTKLPKNSHVVLMGLVNADFIYDNMANKLHPIGLLNKNVRYRDMYNWFNCLQIGPCTGWLNSNKTLRKVTTLRANELTDVLKDIARNEKFEFFKLHFIGNPINFVMEQNKINVPDLLEAVDSLHPNQKAQPILADVVWTSLANNLPMEVLGPINRNNKLIKTLFEDQGGH
ncbi:hypothetical protein NQ317_019387 [Molorchus minor]|uniref:Endonuclease/exonuclease/phosphatase domain-containing protein n=1 Tax=Molorchus minor TaxID=1323400 RepID=A0ABQ9JDV3_9CUCU|nr:hypothetical protein NQ317_019387 [Molorchus minor]